MTATAGWKALLMVCGTYNGTYVACAGIKKATLNDKYNLLDVSTYGTDYVKRIKALADFNLAVDGFFEVDATGQGMFRSLGRAGSDIFWKFGIDANADGDVDGSDGDYGYGCYASGGGSLVGDWSWSADASGSSDFTFSIMSSKQKITELGTAD